MTLRPVHIKIGLLVGILLLVAYFGRIALGDHGWLELNRKKQRLETIEAANSAIEDENLRLYRRVNRLKNDPEYLEYIIRRELSVIGEDQIVFKFESGHH